MVVHRAVAAVAQQMEEGGRNPRKVSGSEKKWMRSDKHPIYGAVYLHPSYHKRHTAFGPGEAPSVVDATLP